MSGLIDTSALWDFEAMKKRQAALPPWSPEHRERVRQELRAHPLVEVTFGPYPLPNGVVGTVTRVVDPQPTVLREERKARAANVRHYCRKCRGLGTKRHHAMCPRRGIGWAASNGHSEPHPAVSTYFKEKNARVAEKLDQVADAVLGVKRGRST